MEAAVYYPHREVFRHRPRFSSNELSKAPSSIERGFFFGAFDNSLKSIAEIYNGDKATYEVPIYQRNYAWEKDEISTLIQDVYDAYNNPNKKTYFIGTLVSFNKGDQIYEVIDGQQRLTTINLILNALKFPMQNKLTYRARKKSNDTIKSIPFFKVD